MSTDQLIRNSQLELNEVYFWTNSIRNWNSLLREESFKRIILDSWKYLVKSKKINIYAFVIMPNHLHVVWELLEMNGKEMPHGSFNKFTAHQFLSKLKQESAQKLVAFAETSSDRSYRFWQRDPLAVLMDHKKKIEQKIDYIHLNPLQEKWNLAKLPEEYKWSSARFYEEGIDEFGILKHYMYRF